MHLALCTLGIFALAVDPPADIANAPAIKRNSTTDMLVEPMYKADEQDPASQRFELSMRFVSNGNASDFEGEIDVGRRLAEEKKPKRKYCNTSAYGLKGDYAYEACGAFCKQTKAANHCKFCKVQQNDAVCPRDAMQHRWHVAHGAMLESMLA